jgi:hypothetical protein
VSTMVELEERRQERNPSHFINLFVFAFASLSIARDRRSSSSSRMHHFTPHHIFACTSLSYIQNGEWFLVAYLSFDACFFVLCFSIFVLSSSHLSSCCYTIASLYFISLFLHLLHYHVFHGSPPGFDSSLRRLAPFTSRTTFLIRTRTILRIRTIGL